MLEAARERLERALPEAEQARWRRDERRDLDNVRRLRAAGVRIATGTDIAWSPWREFGVHLEMELLVKAGFTPLQAIRSATFEGARGLGVDDQLGTIAVGKLADFMIVDGNPAVDIRDTRRIQWVVLRGRPYTRPEILEHGRRGPMRERHRPAQAEPRGHRSERKVPAGSGPPLLPGAPETVRGHHEAKR